MISLFRHQSLPSVLDVQPVLYTRHDQKRITQVNQYLLLKKIGFGASSKIYVSKDTLTGKFYAIKVFKSIGILGDENAFDHFEREIRNLWKFHHENILGVHEALFSDSTLTAYLVLEWARCGCLQDYTQPDKLLELDEIATIFSQVIKGVRHLHDNGLAHKDIKPSNILLFEDGTAKISDFGIGHSFQSADTVVGTPAYQAPEVFGDDEETYEEDMEAIILDPIKEDVWSLGVSLYEVCFGKLPFYGSNEYEIARYARESVLKYDETVPEDLVDLLNGMLNIDPNERFSMSDVTNHRFFKRCIPKKEIHLAQTPEPHLPENVMIRKVEAKVCTPNNLVTIKSIPVSPFPLYLPPRALSRM